MKKLIMYFLIIIFNIQSVYALPSEAIITINGEVNTITLAQQITPKIEIHLNANDDINKVVNFYIIGFATSNNNCLAFDVGLEKDVCGYIYRGLEDQWSSVPLGNTYSGTLQSFNNFSILDIPLPVGVYNFLFFIVDPEDSTLITGSEISLEIQK